MSFSEQPSRPPAQNQPALVPPPIVEWGLILAAVIAGVRYLGKWFLDQSARKEQGEFELMRSLITSLQTQVQGQTEASQRSQAQLFEQIQIKDNMTRMATLLKDDVGRALATQGALYSKALENQTRMEGKIDVCLRQNDEIIKLLGQIVERLGHGDP